MLNLLIADVRPTALDFGETTVSAVLKTSTAVRGDALVKVPDTEPPEVISEDLFPDLQDQNVPVDASIGIALSEPIDADSLVGDAVRVTGQNNRKIEGELTVDGGILIFAPSDPFRDEETITVYITTAVKDLAGNNLAKGFQASFTTGMGIWPGDPNNDGLVNTLDIIPLGRYWNRTGQERNGANMEWQIQTAAPWQPDKMATYADTNGDGIVDADDIVPIAANWNLSHLVNARAPKTGGESVPENSQMASIYEAMYDALDNAPFENDGVRALKKALAEMVSNINKLLNPNKTILLQNYPNPSNPETWIPYQLAEDASVSISIYDVTGKLVRTLEIGQKPAGYYLSKENAAYWDGRNQSGEQVSSGLYFCRFRAGKSESVRKIIQIK